MHLKTVSDAQLLGFLHPQVGMLIIYKPLTLWLMHEKRFCASGSE